MEYLIIGAPFAWIATALIGRAKGSSFWLWLLIGAVLPYFGLIAALLYRRERDEPERRCPRCGTVHKRYVQVCTRCGADLYLLDPSEVTQPSAHGLPPRNAP